MSNEQEHAKALVSAHDPVILAMREAIPDLTHTAASWHDTVVQNVVWVVGLATILLGYLGTKGATLPLRAGSFHTLAVILGFTIVVGVLQRATQLRAQFLETDAAVKLRLALIGFARDEAAITLSLQPYWTREEILRRIKESFRVDLGSSDNCPLTLEQLSEIYRAGFEGTSNDNLKRQEQFAGLLRAVAGEASLPAATAAPTAVSSPLNETAPQPDPYATLRSRGIAVKFWEKASFILYGITNAGFLASVIFLVWSILGG